MCFTQYTIFVTGRRNKKGELLYRMSNSIQQHTSRRSKEKILTQDTVGLLFSIEQVGPSGTTVYKPNQDQKTIMFLTMVVINSTDRGPRGPRFGRNGRRRKTCALVKSWVVKKETGEETKTKRQARRELVKVYTTETDLVSSSSLQGRIERGVRVIHDLWYRYKQRTL